MITAMGCSISWPGLLPPITMGRSARVVVKAVMRIGASRSSAPRRISGDYALDTRMC